MEWKIQDKMTFFFSMLFLLLVTVTLINVSNTVALKEADGIQLSPGQDNSQLLSQTRQTYLFTIISVTALFLGLFYYAVVWPKRKKG